MYPAKRLPVSTIFLLTFLIIVSFLLTACAQVANNNWPGMSASGETVYLAYGPAVAAVDVAEQQVRWTFPTEGNPTLQFYAPPAIGDEHIFVGDYGAAGGFFSPKVIVSVYALDDDGTGEPALAWKESALANDKIVAGPLMVNGQVFVATSDNFVYALDAETGDPQWQFEAGHSIWAQPLYHDGVLYVASLDKSVYALSAENGEQLWQATFDGAIAGQPALGENLLYVGSFDQQLHALDLSSGEEQWTASAEGWVWASPAVKDGTVFYADIEGNVYAVEAETGAERWQVTVPGAIQATPVLVDGTVYIVAGDGDPSEGSGTVLALAADDGAELWRRETAVPLYTTPVVANESLVVALQSQEALLVVYDLVTGDQKWQMAPPEVN